MQPQNNLSTVFVPRGLPKFEELSYDLETAFKNDELNRLLNQPCNKSWIKQHPIVKVKVGGVWKPLEYIPGDKVRYLLTRIFGVWMDEIIDVKQIFNSIVVVVKLSVQNPFTGEWIVRTGIGAVGAQTDAGAGASEMSAIKANAMQIGAPAAASYALKNAAKKLGPVFGGNLNSSDSIQFTGNYQDPSIQNKIAEVKQTNEKANGIPNIETPF